MDADGLTGSGTQLSVGPYHLLQRVGEGGMGVVHLAIDAAGRAVAVKVLRPHVAVDEVGRERLAREVRAMRRVRGAHVAEVLDADVEAELPYVVTRYVSGRPLNVVVRESGPLALPDLLRLAHGLADALVSVHEAGVIHRDLKPANVLLADGVPVVIDFGISQLVDDTRLTSSGLFVGTPGYFAPEIARGEPATPASDVASWAATLAFAATGRAPYGQGPVEVVLANVATGRPNLTGVPDVLLPALRVALADPPETRPTAWQLRDRVGRLLTDSTVVLGHDRDATQVVSEPSTRVLPRGGETRVLPEPEPVYEPEPEPRTWAEPEEERPGMLGGLRYDAPEDDGSEYDPREYPAAEQEPEPAGPAWLLNLAMVALLAAVVALAPVFGAALLGVMLAVLHAGDTSMAMLERRRTLRGRRRGDGFLVLSALPWHLGRGLVSALLALLVGGVVAALVGLGAAGFVAAGGAGSDDFSGLGDPVETAVEIGAGVLAVAAWFGPGSRRYRGGGVRLSRNLGPTFRVVIIILMLAGAVAGFALGAGSPAEWWPWSGVSTPDISPADLIPSIP